MTDIELYDDKTENYILSRLFLSSDIQNLFEAIFDILDKKQDIALPKQFDFFSKFYTKLGFITQSGLGDERKQELILLFFGQNASTQSDFKSTLEWYSKSIETFRKTDVEVKGFLLHFFELIVEKKMNIDDEHYDFFITATQDREKIYVIIEELVLYGLSKIKDEIENLLENKRNFFDVFFSYEENFLSHQELMLFKKHFYDLIQKLYIYLTSDKDIKEKISQIQQRIEAKIDLVG